MIAAELRQRHEAEDKRLGVEASFGFASFRNPLEYCSETTEAVLHDVLILPYFVNLRSFGGSVWYGT